MTTLAADRREAPGWAQTAMLTWRLIVQRIRNPAVTLPNLIIAVFFLFVYDGALGGADAIESVTGGNYVNFCFY